MWLLSTDRAELHFFTAPEDVGRYAILSHVWDRAEQSFKELRKLEKRCAATGDVPRNLVGDKIRRCCELAEQHGYKWVWIDTCCIDKSSSAELSEAINSMYRYYSHSSICYAHLGDISCALPATFVNNLPDTDRQPPLGFAQSRWHQRGWTLQELIAAPFVVFVDREGGVLGSKAGFAEALQACTGIPECLLKHEQQLNDFSIAQRMSWAAHRATTRLEDEAYCLLGIFDIQMPTLYGEGRRAFQRLQEEIMKRSEDTTLFAWGCRRLRSPSTLNTH
ncbi:HET-domain-containing protein [Lentinus brumalis]|uniref:HET-domain-containing protein n=1 Tax=Lentinus brumalis TaxID=2498619 RepID=A0A371DB09_9APHY|nr:HET-domain-containing protein [Polyporus brumalis]